MTFERVDDINKHYFKIKERILKDISDFNEFFIYFKPFYTGKINVTEDFYAVFVRKMWSLDEKIF